MIPSARTPAKTSADLSRDGVALPWESGSRLAELLKSDFRLLLMEPNTNAGSGQRPNEVETSLVSKHH